LCYTDANSEERGEQYEHRKDARRCSESAGKGNQRESNRDNGARAKSIDQATARQRRKTHQRGGERNQQAALGMREMKIVGHIGQNLPNTNQPGAQIECDQAQQRKRQRDMVCRFGRCIRSSSTAEIRE
jgi:hypothetical protein